MVSTETVSRFDHVHEILGEVGIGARALVVAPLVDRISAVPYMHSVDEALEPGKLAKPWGLARLPGWQAGQRLHPPAARRPTQEPRRLNVSTTQ